MKKPKLNLARYVNILFIVSTFYLLFAKRNELTNILKDSGEWTPVLATLLLAVLGPTPIATDPILILVSVSYDPFIAVFVGTVGNTLAMLFEYFVGYKILKEFRPRTKISRISIINRVIKWFYQLPINSPWFLLLGRMIPGYGSKVISLIAGSYKVKMKLYLWTSFLSALFGAIMTSYGAFGLFELIKYTTYFK